MTSVVSASASTDTKPYVEHHALFGYSYIPGVDLELPRPGGGRYHLQINSAGIRSSREYVYRKPAGVCRIIVCGDSMTAGQFVSNDQRFSELLERRIPGLEVINLALEGSGTDQQLLLYENIGLKYEHDVVILLPFLQNIRRNLVEAREAVDARTGEKVFRPKPRYELVGGNLVLRNVPVPKDVTAAMLEKNGGTDAPYSALQAAKARLSALPGSTALKKVLYALVPWEPFPEYRDPRGREWQLMAALILRFKELAGNRPLVLAPTFYANYVRFQMARNYWDRCAELGATPGIHPVDLLPHFRNAGEDSVRCFQEPHDMHFSAFGNLVLAGALEDELKRLKLFSGKAPD